MGTLSLLPAKKGAASVHFTQLVDNPHWLLRDEQQETLDYIVAISEQAAIFETFVERISRYNHTGIFVAKTYQRSKAQRFSYAVAHAYARELSRHYNQETRVERVTSASSEVA